MIVKAGDKVFVDNGHGGRDGGASAGGVHEKDLALTLGTFVCDELEKRGVIVNHSRIDDTFPSLSERALASNQWRADLFVSIHFNSFTNAVANGAEVLVYSDPGTASTVGRRVLEHLTQDHDVLLPNRGVKVRTGLAVLKQTQAPALLIESAFLSNADERDYVNNVDNLRAMAVSIVDGLMGTLGMEQAEDFALPAPTPSPSPAPHVCEDTKTIDQIQELLKNRQN